MARTTLHPRPRAEEPLPVFHTFPDLRTAALVVVALRNESTALVGESRDADATILALEANRLERAAFSLRPIPYRAALADVRFGDDG